MGTFDGLQVLLVCVQRVRERLDKRLDLADRATTKPREALVRQLQKRLVILHQRLRCQPLKGGSQLARSFLQKFLVAVSNPSDQATSKAFVTSRCEVRQSLTCNRCCEVTDRSSH